MSKRNDIMAATMGLITEVGLSSVTLSKILERADVGSGTLYNYFSGKDDLIKVLYQEARERMNALVFENLDSSEGIRLRFDRIMTNFLEYCLGNLDELNFVQQYIYQLHKNKAIDFSTLEPETNQLIDLFRVGEEQKILKPLEPSILLQIVTGIMIQIATGYHGGKYSLTEQNKNEAVRACWDAIRA